MVMDVNDRSVNVERFDSHINASEVNCDKNERLGHDDGNWVWMARLLSARKGPPILLVI